MRIIVVVAGVVLGAASGQADCRNALSQAQMNACAGEAHKKADAELNAAYRELNKRVEGGSAKLLVAAQRAWITFRDAECAFTAAGSTGGSVHPMVVSNCLEEQTKKRAAEIKAHLGCEEGDLACPAFRP